MQANGGGHCPAQAQAHHLVSVPHDGGLPRGHTSTPGLPTAPCRHAYANDAAPFAPYPATWPPGGGRSCCIVRAWSVHSTGIHSGSVSLCGVLVCSYGLCMYTFRMRAFLLWHQIVIVSRLRTRGENRSSSPAAPYCARTGHMGHLREKRYPRSRIGCWESRAVWRVTRAQKFLAIAYVTRMGDQS